MIVAAVVCPHPPLLLRELSGAEDALPDLRRACRDALHEAFAVGPGAVVVVGGADVAGEWDAAVPADVRRFGTTGPRPGAGAGPAAGSEAGVGLDPGAVPGSAPSSGGALPLSLGVATRLLEEAGWDGPVRLVSVPWAADDDAVAAVARDVAGAAERTLLVVMGDGSSCRGEKAPGYLDERAFGYDAEIVRALEEGDAAALTRLDPVLAGDLAVAGRAALAVLGRAVADQRGPGRSRVLWSGDPFGVQYTVALWDLSAPD